ncbi:MAG: hypothetical protein EOM20_02400 [Spartobacteria bacterium]|nr:hypothetical protein [Spartobacteria bacterium]
MRDRLDDDSSLDEDLPDAKPEERLYRVRVDRYVQYNGEGPLPEIIERYRENRGGDMPPYMLLPELPVDFDIGYGHYVRWEGEGPLPDEVMEYVSENGFLPRYKADAVPDDDDEEDDDDE